MRKAKNLMTTTANVIIETTKTSDTYILDLLIDTNKEDETQGCSERWIFDTEAEQLEQKVKLENEYGINNIISKDTEEK